MLWTQASEAGRCILDINKYLHPTLLKDVITYPIPKYMLRVLKSSYVIMIWNYWLLKLICGIV